MKFILAFIFMTSQLAQAQDFYGQVFADVSQQSLIHLLKDMTGVNEVNVDGKSIKISERYSPAGKQNFRAYFTDYFQKLGAEVNTLNFQTSNNLESEGHNVEAVIHGESTDSVIVIVHYDSIGPSGEETGNPGVDDDMSGMATSLETARLVTEYLQSGKAKLKYTLRFVAADYEEWGGLEGARNYARYIQGRAQSENFKIIAAVDNEQEGWSCVADGSCSGPETVDIFSCSTNRKYDFPSQGDMMEKITKTYSSLQVSRSCMNENSDHYAMWEIGVPTIVFSEHSPFENPHFDGEGGDIFEKIDQGYFFKIAQVGVTYALQLAGLEPR